MHIVDELPRDISENETWIPMSDGARLSARIWRPVDSDANPVPAVLEYIPYRQRDLTSVRDSIHHPYLAGHGYACVRVDLRGSGNSDGVLTDEYLEQELIDGEEVLAWLAAQPWCTGRTGMVGISWGGFNALQIAARRPPSLSAIAALSCADDRYADDVHYMGGCLLSDNLSWASVMFADTACPPDPAVVGDRWMRMWQERLEGSGLWLDTWLRHQRRDDYWRHGSVCEDFGDVACPVLAVSGWADGYSNAVFRLMQHLDVPRRGLIGPWSHKYPHIGEPGPAIGFLQELVRWWDHWLKDVDNGVMDAPTLCTWMQESMPPSTSYEQRPGRWVGEPSWPSPNVRRQRYPLGWYRIESPGEPVRSDVRLIVSSPLSVGQYGGKWCSYNAPPDLPYDQREEDGGSLVFDTDPLPERCEILGGPLLDLCLEVDRPVAMLAARLSDVSPDGQATRVTYGLLNLTHRDGHAEPKPLEPGTPQRVQLRLNGVAQAFPAGHRIRLALSTSYWPLAWPPPEPVRMTVHPGESELELPVRPAEAEELPADLFGEPEGAPEIRTEQVVPGEQHWRVSRDLVRYDSALEVVKDLGTLHFDDIDLDVERRAEETYSWVADDFDSVRGHIEWTMRFSRGEWTVSTATRTTLSSTPDEFLLHAELDAYVDDRRVFCRDWDRRIPRDHV